MKKDKERIKNGECVSPMTTERCPYCVDTCDAFQNKLNLKSMKTEQEKKKLMDRIWDDCYLATPTIRQCYQMAMEAYAECAERPLKNLNIIELICLSEDAIKEVKKISLTDAFSESSTEATHRHLEDLEAEIAFIKNRIKPK